MNKKIREKLDSWDLKSFFLTILFLSIGLALYLYFTGIRDRFRDEDTKLFTGKTTGQVLSIEKSDRITQSRWNGTKIFIDSYKVTYQFQYKGKTIQGIDIIQVTKKNELLLTAILKKGANDTCTVKFDKNDPRKSLLVESEER